MSEKDLDIAIEKCKRIMEFDTRTLENPESENGHIFEKVYDLLQFLSQFQFATCTKVGGMNDLISRQAAIDTVRKAKDKSEAHRMLVQLPSAQPEQRWTPTSKKPPEPFQLVLIQDSYGGYDLTMYIPPRINPKKHPDGYWGEVDSVDYDYFDVDKWCSIPE